MAKLELVKTEKDYSWSNNPEWEKFIRVTISTDELSKSDIIQFAPYITSYQKDGSEVTFSIWEHNQVGWKKVHNWLSPEQAKIIIDNKEWYNGK